MHSSALLFVLVALASPVTPSEHLSHDKVNVTVYLETMCKDSAKFFMTQLQPMWEQMKEIVNLDINAFGKSNYSMDSSNCYNFDCNHGPEECESNLLVTCAKRYIVQGDQFMTYLGCLYSAFNNGEVGPDRSKKCASQAGMCHNGLESCRNSPEGKELHKEQGCEIEKLDPPLNWVPYVTINGEYSPLAENDLKAYVCKEYKGDSEFCNCDM